MYKMEFDYFYTIQVFIISFLKVFMIQSLKIHILFNTSTVYLPVSICELSRSTYSIYFKLKFYVSWLIYVVIELFSKFFWSYCNYCIKPQSLCHPHFENKFDITSVFKTVFFIVHTESLLFFFSVYLGRNCFNCIFI